MSLGSFDPRGGGKQTGRGEDGYRMRHRDRKRIGGYWKKFLQFLGLFSEYHRPMDLTRPCSTRRCLIIWQSFKKKIFRDALSGVPKEIWIHGLLFCSWVVATHSRHLCFRAGVFSWSICCFFKRTCFQKRHVFSKKLVSSEFEFELVPSEIRRPTWFQRGKDQYLDCFLFPSDQSEMDIFSP